MNPVSNTERAEPTSLDELVQLIRAADAMAKAVDDAVGKGLLNARHPIADARLDYSMPHQYNADCAKALRQHVADETAQLRAQLEAKEHELRTVLDLDASVVADLKAQLELAQGDKERLLRLLDDFWNTAQIRVNIATMNRREGEVDMEAGLRRCIKEARAAIDSARGANKDGK